MPFPLRTRTRGRPSRNAGVVNVAAAPSFNPLTDFSTDPVHGVWASDPSWSAPADGGAVSSWRNGGSVGGDLVQATGARRPTYRASTAAFNNQPTVSFDGTDDVLAMDPTDIPQPYWVVMVAKVDAFAGAAGFGAKALGIGQGSAFYGLGSNTTPAWELKGVTSLAGGTADTSPHLVLSASNGASSLIAVDGATIASGNSGTLGLALLSLGSGAIDLTTFGTRWNGHIAYAAVFTTDPTALPEWDTFKAWCLSFYGITVA